VKSRRELGSTNHYNYWDEDSDHDSGSRRNFILMLPRIHIHIGFEPLDTFHIIIQSLVLLQLIHEARVRIDEPPSLAYVEVSLVVSHIVLLHQICNNDGGGPGHPEMAMNEHASLLEPFFNEGVGHREVGQEIGLRSVVGPNEEGADVCISKSRLRKTVRLNGEHMGDVKLPKHSRVRSCPGIAQVEARENLAVARLCAEVNFVIERLSGPVLEACERHHWVWDAKESDNERASQHHH
jgi:hypothetical protein